MMRLPVASSISKVALWLIVATLLALGWNTSAMATCGDYLSHDQHFPSLRVERTTDPSVPLAFPGTNAPKTPCQGLECSRQSPAAPISIPVTVTAEKQASVLSIVSLDLTEEPIVFADPCGKLPLYDLAPAERPPSLSKLSFGQILAG